MEMLTLTEKLALLGERINAPALTDIILRSLHFFDATIYLILFIVRSSWDVLEKKKTWFLYPGFSFLYSKYLKSYNLCRSRKQILAEYLYLNFWIPYNLQATKFWISKEKQLTILFDRCFHWLFFPNYSSRQT